LSTDSGSVTYRGSPVGVALATLVIDPGNSSPAELLEAADAATDAGFATLTVWPQHIVTPGQPRRAADVAPWRGRVSAVESALGFTRGATPELAAAAGQMVDLAADLGASMIAVSTMRSVVEDLAAAADGLAVVASAAARQRLTVCLEFLPWTGIASLAAAWEIISRPGLENVCVVVDSWHFQRQPGGPDHSVLESIPGSRIPYVQLCDAGPNVEAGDDVMAEAMTRRLLPGDGIVELGRLQQSLDLIGAAPLYVVETFNTELASRGPRAAAAQMRRSIELMGDPHG
jgi:sugar phosphate isomerase/epimerase